MVPSNSVRIIPLLPLLLIALHQRFSEGISSVSLRCGDSVGQRVVHELDEEFYWECTLNGIFEKFKCPVLYKKQHIFDPSTLRCISPQQLASLHWTTELKPVFQDEGQKNRTKRQTGISSSSQASRVGQVCYTNTDCIDGGYCLSGKCTCWSTHVVINGFCWRKINPDQSGCEYDDQCTSVWPGATCSSNVCKCPFSQAPAQTADGPVCIIPNECPTNRANPKLTQDNSNTLATCSFIPNSASTSQQNLGQLMAVDCAGTDANTYDCIPQPGQTIATGNIGYCCPKRALACIQKQSSGSVSTTTQTSTRYWYNTITQGCTSFTYYGSGGNANNFLTQEQCESYCKQTCQRGNPEYDLTILNTNVQNGAWRYCSSTSTGTAQGCGTNFQCDRIGSLQLCCPTASWICSANGGIGPVGQIREGIIQGLNGGRSVRWYWDTLTRTCKTFQYGGGGGDFNNFQSQSECQDYCAKALCPQGTPITDQTQGYKQCSGDSNCPRTHYCTSSVCCPRPVTVCNQPTVTGAGCNAGVQRYAFDPYTGACRDFEYTGCQGNANNFASLLDCQEYCNGMTAEPKCIQGKALRNSDQVFYTCSTDNGITSNAATNINNCPSGYSCYFDGQKSGCCPTKTFTCSQPSDTGTSCNPTSSTRYYFDDTTRQCVSFQYLGCDGNSNNFATKKDCEEYCGATGCPDGGNPIRNNGAPVICSITNQCTSGYTCTQVNLANTVSTLTNNQAFYCCPKKSTICSQPQSAGTSCLTGGLDRFWYDSNNGVCVRFTYGGCGGNANNFPNPITCQNFCNSAACDAGDRVYLDQTQTQTVGNNQINTQNNLRIIQNIRTCQPSVLNTCPRDYRCVADPNRVNRNVCCGSTNRGECPAGQRAYIDATSGDARQCTPNRLPFCPTGYLCVYNPSLRLAYCCGTRGSDICPSNKVAYVDSDSNPQACTLGADNVCPAGYSCETTSVLASQIGYCCSGISSVGQCGGGTVQFENNVPKTCSGVGSRQCAASYVCTRSSNGDNLSYCCNPLAVNNVCGGGQAYLNQGQPVECNNNNGNGNSGLRCPGSFVCQASASGNGKNYCCSSGSFSAYCGESSPFLINGRPQTCVPNTASPNTVCRQGYICELSKELNTYYCCAGSGCPTGYVSYIATNGRQQTCNRGNGNNECPSGYSCLANANNNAVSQCCRLSAVANDCPAGSEAFIDAATGRPQTCSTISNTNSCQIGYTCTGTTGGQAFCCRPTGQSVCPGGRVTYINPSTGQNQNCQLNNPATCPGNTQCATVTGGRNICCGPLSSPPNPTCGTAAAFINPNTGQAQSCLNGIACPTGYTCNGQICCPNNGNSPQPRCARGSSAYVSQNTGQTFICAVQGTQSNCPSGYICTGGNGNSALICCPGTLASCPAGTQVLIDPSTNTAQTCQNVACPGGYQCVRTNRYQICCTNNGQQQSSSNTPTSAGVVDTSGICPNNGTPYRANGQIQTCLIDQQFNCPTNYVCTRQASTNAYACCPSGSVTFGAPATATLDCSGGVQSVKYPNSDSPLGCGSLGTNCPSGSGCQQSPRYGQPICCEGNGPRRLRENSLNFEPMNDDVIMEGEPYGVCDPGFVWSPESAACLQEIGFNESGCEESIQCVNSHGVCLDRTCICPSPMAIYNEICVKECPENHRNDDGFCIKEFLVEAEELISSDNERFLELHIQDELEESSSDFFS